MSSFLAQMAERSAERVAAARATVSVDELEKKISELPAVTPLRLNEDQLDVIAEIKMTSPAEGTLSHDKSLDAIFSRVEQYVNGGACALSVLTEPDRFDGSLAHLQAVATIVQDSAAGSCAVMRKDFLVDPYQVWEARAAGADGVLLILRMLDDATLHAMLNLARQLDMFVLLEAFDEEELRRCEDLIGDNVLVGLNCRDLSTLKIDPARFANMIGAFPAQSVKVAESGIHVASDAAALYKMGYDVALIGTALMKSSNPELFLRELRGSTVKVSQ